jgi:outer membrane protein
MNKNFSLILNVILLIAVGVLYYLHFTSCSNTCAATATTADSTITEKPVVMTPKEIKTSKIVYINIDVISKNYELLKDLTAVIRAEQQSIENQYKTKGRKLQEDAMALDQKASAGLLSENEVNAQSEKLRTRKSELDQLQGQLSLLEDRVEKQNEDANQKFRDYIKEYNKTSNYTYVLGYSDGPMSPLLLANDSLDITNEIIEGLNAQYRAEKKK